MSLPPIPLAEAWERLLSAAEPLPGERVPADGAAGRYLAQDLAAQRTQPAADLSSMDGYAVAWEDERGPWQVVGESAAGHPFAGSIAPGQAIRISTGALMPEGGAAVLLQENAVRDGDRLSLNGEGVPAARHIRRRGFDFEAGAVVLPAGTRIGPAQLALALSSGNGSLPVARLPTLAVLDSGDELAPDPEHCAVHQVPASNGAMLAALAAPHAASVRRAGPVGDDMDALAGALARCSDVDVLVTSGGASVGDHDLVRPALEAWGARIDFWKVALKPGKPLMVARRRNERGADQWILGLPGNPVSSFVTAFLFMLPLLRRLGGCPRGAALPARRSGIAGGPLPGAGDRHEFLRGRFDEGGRIVAVSEQDSSALAALGRSELLIDRPPFAPAAGPGEQVWYYPLENGGNA